MSLHLITGYAGQEHITAADHASFNISMFGAGEFVLDRGNKFKAEIVSNNLIKILDGDMMIQGRHVRLAENTYEELMIENGTQGMNRNDLIVARYSKDATTGIENCEFVVLKGEANASAAADPTYTQGDITEQGNDLVTEYPLYRIKLNGLNIESVNKLFTIGETLQSVKDELKGTIGYSKKQLIPYPYDALVTENGMVFTDLGDGRIEVNGSNPNGTSSYYLHYANSKYKPNFNNSKVTLSLKSVSGQASVFFRLWGEGGTYIKEYDFAIDRKNGSLTIDMPNETDYSYATIELFYYQGSTVTNDIVEIMIRYASIQDDTYEPYVPSVKSLVCDVEKIDVSKKLSIAANTATLIHTYKAVKRCKISMSVFVCGENAAICPAFISVYLGDRVVSYNRLASANGHAMTMPVNMILEAGESIAIYTQFFHAGNNTVIITGHAQNLE